MDRIKYLILAFLREEITPAEEAELDAWRGEDPANEQLLADLQDPALVTEALTKLDQLHRQEAWGKVELYASGVRAATGIGNGELEARGGERGGGVYDLTRPSGRVRRIYWIRAGIAAACLGLLGAGIWWIEGRKPSEPQSEVVTTGAKADVQAPASNRATLTLSNGQQIFLDSAANGQLAKEGGAGGASIQKNSNGLLAYVNAGTGAAVTPASAILYNTLSNPRGSRVINLTLLDGTKVWLNAASSIRYPAVFSGKDRTVELTGEGYFEVAKNTSSPFKVVVRDRSVVEVLGTNFNVKAYEDESFVRTTLVDGAVRVWAGEGKRPSLGSVVLKPGQQSELHSVDTTKGATAGAIHIEKNVDVESVLAWKNGRFSFNHADLQEVMRQMARWYNVDVTYEGQLPERYFHGTIGRTLTLDQVLKVLTNTRVHYEIQPGNKLVIKP